MALAAKPNHVNLIFRIHPVKGPLVSAYTLQDTSTDRDRQAGRQTHTHTQCNKKFKIIVVSSWLVAKKKSNYFAHDFKHIFR